MPKTKSATSARSKAAKNSAPAWAKFSDEKLLDMRMCDLGLKFEDTPLVKFRDQLYGELAERGLRIRGRRRY